MTNVIYSYDFDAAKRIRELEARVAALTLMEEFWHNLALIHIPAHVVSDELTRAVDEAWAPRGLSETNGRNDE